MSAIRVTNPAGLALIQQWEGLSLTAYRDIAGVWTIGWGHTGGVFKGQVITELQAIQLLMRDLAGFESVVAARTDLMATTDDQFAAMVSLSYNIGVGGFLGSTVLRDHKAGNFDGAGAAFLLWDKAHVDGELVVVRGLLNRRIAEAALYARPDN
jgi:lysozyme